MEYFIINTDRKVEIKIKRSRFIALLHPVETIKDAKEFISQISKEHKTANHNCWAYIIGDKGETFHSSDAGEPSGTAGKPILNALKQNNLTNIAVVVTRYFGGVKLGIRGLIEAYSEIVEQAIEEEPLKKLVKTKKYEIITNYEFSEQLKYMITKLGGEISDIDYSENVKFFVSIDSSKQIDFESYLNELQKSGKIINWIKKIKLAKFQKFGKF